MANRRDPVLQYREQCGVAASDPLNLVETGAGRVGGIVGDSTREYRPTSPTTWISPGSFHSPTVSAFSALILSRRVPSPRSPLWRSWLMDIENEESDIQQKPQKLNSIPILGIGSNLCPANVTHHGAREVTVLVCPFLWLFLSCGGDLRCSAYSAFLLLCHLAIEFRSSLMTPNAASYTTPFRSHQLESLMC
jgi:hypothetical protein